MHLRTCLTALFLLYPIMPMIGWANPTQQINSYQQHDAYGTLPAAPEQDVIQRLQRIEQQRQDIATPAPMPLPPLQTSHQTIVVTAPPQALRMEYPAAIQPSVPFVTNPAQTNPKQDGYHYVRQEYIPGRGRVMPEPQRQQQPAWQPHIQPPSQLDQRLNQHFGASIQQQQQHAQIPSSQHSSSIIPRVYESDVPPLDLDQERTHLTLTHDEGTTSTITSMPSFIPIAPQLRPKRTPQHVTTLADPVESVSHALEHIRKTRPESTGSTIATQTITTTPPIPTKRQQQRATPVPILPDYQQHGTFVDPTHLEPASGPKKPHHDGWSQLIEKPTPTPPAPITLRTKKQDPIPAPEPLETLSSLAKPHQSTQQEKHLLYQEFLQETQKLLEDSTPTGLFDRQLPLEFSAETVMLNNKQQSRITAFLQEYRPSQVTIAASPESGVSGKQLALKRAMNIRRYLTEQGVETNQIKIHVKEDRTLNAPVVLMGK